MTTFRVFMAGNGYIDIDAASPDAARKQAREIYPSAILTKVKVVKEKADA